MISVTMCWKPGLSRDSGANLIAMDGAKEVGVRERVRESVRWVGSEGRSEGEGEMGRE